MKNEVVMQKNLFRIENYFAKQADEILQNETASHPIVPGPVVQFVRVLSVLLTRMECQPKK